MSILLLGGTQEARQLARTLLDQGFKLIYSQQQLLSQPDLACPIHTGGFSSQTADGVAGLSAFCRTNQIQLLVDATHPYAQRISAQAMEAARQSHLPLVQYHRVPWLPTAADHWQEYTSLADIGPAVGAYQRPFFSIGQSVEALYPGKRNDQPWLIRQITPPRQQPVNTTYQLARGPFSIKQEIQLMQEHNIDVLVSKNSGGPHSYAKILAARALHLPVLLWQRPAFMASQYCYQQLDECVAACLSLSQPQAQSAIQNGQRKSYVN